MKTTYIYTLVDPREPEHVRYVGKADDPKARFRQHLHSVKTYKKRRYVYCWIGSLLKVGVTPDMNIIEEVAYKVKEDWASREQHWISLYRISGHKLTNLTEGGDGIEGFKHSEECKKRMNAHRIGKPGTPHTEESKRKLSEAHKGKVLGPMSEEQKKLRSEKTKGIPKGPFSEEHRKNLSESHKGYIMPEEQRLKIGEKSKGRKQSEETTRKRQETKIKNGTTGHGKVMSEETKKKLSAKNKGRKMDPVEVAERVARRKENRLKRLAEEGNLDSCGVLHEY